MSELNHMTAPALLQVENLRVSFRNEEKQYIETVKGISFSIPVNTTVALVGESGSGKSVTSLATMGLLSTESSQIASDSKILFEGQNLLDLPLPDSPTKATVAFTGILKLMPLTVSMYCFSSFLKLTRKFST